MTDMALHYWHTVGEDRHLEWVACPITKTTKRHVYITVSGSHWLGLGEHEATVSLDTLNLRGNARATARVEKDGKTVRRSIKVFTADAMLREKAHQVWERLLMSATVSFNQCKADIIALAREAGTDPTREMVFTAIERNGGKPSSWLMGEARPAGPPARSTSTPP